ncbi:aspartate aminotransferase, mitochondrial-like [Nymphaea colorata]|nr:aspartate aminotransferase, mitochondrial-like [Nymphaea colorata]
MAAFMVRKRWFSGSSIDWWDGVKPAAKDPIFAITEAFLADDCPSKINLGVGTYRDEKGRPVILECVRRAEAKIGGVQTMEYLPIGGDPKLVQETIKLAYGENSDAVKENRVAGIQALSGTGSCRLFAEFQRRFRPESPMYLPIPTWSNHHNIWRDAHVTQRTFHYYHHQSKGLDFGKLMEDVKNAPDSSFFLFHACAHNPTGVDPSEEQWKEISHLFKVKKHFPFFDVAYQGFASGDPEKDARAIRIFLEDGHKIACAHSFSKIMGLYGLRVGCLSIVCKDAEQSAAVKSQLQQIARPIYSNPPVHGALLVYTILTDPDLRSLWLAELKVMVSRINVMRNLLRKSIENFGSLHNWEHITNQIGMFCYTGLSPEQVDRLVNEFHIYMTRSGRISMAGITPASVDYLAKAIHEVTKHDR